MLRFSPKLRLLITVTAFFAGIAAGCGMRTEGWGVMLWSHDEAAYPTGSIVPVVDSSLLNETYDIRLDRRSPVDTIPQWRLAVFNRKSQAEDYQSRYAEYRELYAVAALNGLPVRETQDPDAKRVYKLREREAVKVLDRDAGQSTAGEYTGYWYQVLTDGGVTGYSFDRYLEFYTAEELSRLDLTEETDEFLEHFLSHNFRPKYFRNMLVTRRIDLDRFLPEYGIFPDPDNNELVISTEDHRSTIEYEGIERGTEDSYAFTGSTLLMIVKTNYEVNLQYADQGVQYSEDFVRIDPDIDLLIIEELERRAAKFEEFYERGNTLDSTAYGNIALVEGGGFVWEGFDRLVPEVIDPSAGNSGTVDFQLHLSSELYETYDGVITFLFAGGQPVHFIYTLDQQGLRFKHLQWPEEYEDPLVENAGTSPIVIFFRVSNKEPEQE
jgi:hypothetical protein